MRIARWLALLGLIAFGLAGQVSAQSSAAACAFAAPADADPAAVQHQIDDDMGALKANPNNAAVLLDRANAYQALDLFDLALTDYAQLMTLGSKQDARCGLAITYWLRARQDVSDGVPEVAFADVNQAIAIDAQSAPVYDLRAVIELDQNTWTAALVDLNHALALQPSYADAYLHRAGLYTLLHQPDKASADYWQFVLLGSREIVQTEPLILGLPMSVDLQAGRAYLIPFDGEAGQVITLTANDASGSDVDPMMVLLDSAHHPLIADDNGGGDIRGGEGHENSLIQNFRLPADEQYWVAVTHSSAVRCGHLVYVTLTQLGLSS